MIKQEELSNPQSCLNRAAFDEMLFVLLARDQAAPATIRYWASERIRLGKNSLHDEQIIQALHCADYMEGEKREGERESACMKQLGFPFVSESDAN